MHLQPGANGAPVGAVAVGGATGVGGCVGAGCAGTTTAGVSAAGCAAGGCGAVGASAGDVLVKSSCDVRALTYCDLKCVHIVGLVEVLRLYPEYQQQFANDIQHDLTYNLREGYEAEQESEHNGVPSLTLPSISEDDENTQEDGDGEGGGDASPLSQFASPARHAKFANRVDDHRRRPDRFDDQVSSLHQDVAALSQEVRSAIHALQQLANTTRVRPAAAVAVAAAAQAAYARSLPARSNPDLPLPQPIGIPRHPVLQRACSHPPDMSTWPPILPLPLPPILPMLHHHRPCSPPTLPPANMLPPPFPPPLQCRATQTDFPVDMFERFVVENPDRVMALLGLTITYDEPRRPARPVRPRRLTSSMDDVWFRQPTTSTSRTISHSRSSGWS